MEHCALPRLSGRGPLSGSLLSHDFVEAAWMRRSGYQVWLAPGIAGSYEELPPTLLDSLKRDRRWCQGNLQHARLLLEPGLHGVQRLNLLLGIVAYAMAPLWLAFLVLSTVSAARSGGGVHARPTLASLFHRGQSAPISDTALGLFLLTVFLLLAPADRWICALVEADGAAASAARGSPRPAAQTLSPRVWRRS
jgi:membrane glycosyltransferase